MPTPPTSGLVGRSAECAALDRVRSAVDGGSGEALVVRGEAGVGKSSLLDYLSDRASGFLILRAAGVQSEMELVYAGLHQLLRPVLHLLDALPAPQQTALRTAFGLSDGPAPEPFLVALAALGLLSEAAEKQPVLCVVDDEHWLDRASVRALAFVARRLEAEPVGVILGSREPGNELAGLPELVVTGLADVDARQLLDSVLTGPVDQNVRDQIIAETRGNPLALVQLPRGMTPSELAGGFGLLDATPLSGRIEESFVRQLEGLPQQTQQLLVLAAADATGDPILVRRAASMMKIPVEASLPAADAGLMELGARVRFRHPLVRSAAYHSAPLNLRQDAHAALARSTDAEVDPDRRAWHLAQAAAGPDEDVALELEHSATRAQRRGGLAAEAAFLERAALLTPDPGRRSERLLAAARRKHTAGAIDEASDLLAAAQAGSMSTRQKAELQWLRGRIALDQGRTVEGVQLLHLAAAALSSLDDVTAREAHLEALFAACVSNGRGVPGGLRGVARIALAAPPAPAPPRPNDLALDAFAVLLSEGHAAAAPMLTAALESILALPESTEDELYRKWILNGQVVSQMALVLWDFDSWQLVASRLVQLARDLGAPVTLQDQLNMLAGTMLLSGDLAAAERLMDEERLISEASGTPPDVYTAAILAAWQGRDEDALAMIRAVAQLALERDQVSRWDAVEYGEAVLHNSRGRYAAALDIARRIFEHDSPGLAVNVLPEVAEAAARTHDSETLAAVVDYVSAVTRVTRTEWALGLDARIRALATGDAAADALYQESIDRLGRTPVRAQVARSHLLYGEWLRRQGRRLDARAQLRTAYALFDEMGMGGFAERTRRELAATGETARKRATGPTPAAREPLTRQEAEIARLARDGLSNPQIGARLFISSRTVQYHLKKVFTKLDITSRGQLYRVLDATDAPGPPAAG